MRYSNREGLSRGKENRKLARVLYHKDEKVDGFLGREVEHFFRIENDVVEAKVDTPKGEEKPGHDQHVGDVSEKIPVERRFTCSALYARSFAGDEVGGNEGYEHDEGDDCNPQC